MNEKNMIAQAFDDTNPEVQRLRQEVIAKDARIFELEHERDASIVRLMDEIELRHGSHADCWKELRELLEQKD